MAQRPEQLELDFGEDFARQMKFLAKTEEAPLLLSLGVKDSAGRKSYRRLLFNLWVRLRPDTVGIVTGLIGFLMAMTPSLLPRTWLFQGVACGLSAATAYAIGVLLHWVWELWLDELIVPRVVGFSEWVMGDPWGPSPMDRVFRRLEARSMRERIAGRSASVRFRILLDAALFLAVPIATIIMCFFAVRWQNQLADVMDSEAYSPAKFMLVLPVGLGLWAAIVGVARLIGDLVGWLASHGPSRFGMATRTVVTWLLVIVLFVVVCEKLVPGTLQSASGRVFAVRNSQIRSDLKQPTVPERSGSPESEADWNKLGAYGTRFTALGLHKNELQKVTGKPAKEPIRVYAGLENEPDDRARAELVVRELERTKAQDREVLFVIPTTGTGWVNPTVAQAIELMFNGDTAIAADQYSYFPSALQFMFSQERVAEAGRVLINTVVDWWNTLPQDHRPRLYVYGESLGTSAGEGAFSGLRDIINSVDGVLFVGPPNSNRLWRQFEARRDPGSPEAEPSYADGLTVRFANSPETIWSWKESSESPSQSPGWSGARVLYLQHASDPVVWWSPRLLFHRPDWLKEAAREDRSPAMVYRPILTFWQVTLDLPMAANVPDGHGHNYGKQVLDGLAAVAGNGQFTQSDMPALKTELATAMEGQGPEKEIGVDQSKTKPKK